MSEIERDGARSTLRAAEAAAAPYMTKNDWAEWAAMHRAVADWR